MPLRHKLLDRGGPNSLAAEEEEPRASGRAFRVKNRFFERRREPWKATGLLTPVFMGRLVFRTWESCYVELTLIEAS